MIYIKSIFLFVLLMLSSSTYAIEYRLAMSKNDKLCNYVKNNYGKVEMLMGINWKKISDSYNTSYYSILDINNDKKNEIVIKGYGTTQGLDTTFLSVYPLNGINFNEKFTAKMFIKSPGKIGLSSLSYPLKEFSKRPLVGEESYLIDNAYYRLSAIKVLPFIFGNKVYVALQDWPNAKRRKWLLIAEYNSGELWGVYKPENDNVLNDICYLEIINK